MKHFIVLTSFLIACTELSAQKDSLIKINPVIANPIMKMNTKPPRVRITEIEMIFKQIEVKLKEINLLADKLKDKKDSISEMNQQDMLMLQQLMEKKNKLEQMISNTMKTATEGAQAAIQALKAS